MVMVVAVAGAVAVTIEAVLVVQRIDAGFAFVSAQPQVELSGRAEHANRNWLVHRRPPFATKHISVPVARARYESAESNLHQKQQTLRPSFRLET